MLLLAVTADNFTATMFIKEGVVLRGNTVDGMTSETQSIGELTNGFVRLSRG
jgi:hypothetical protein